MSSKRLLTQGRSACRHMQGLAGMLILGFVLSNPDTTTAAAPAATIDETMPSTIPAEIIADWENQDGTDYAKAITAIKEAIPKVFADKITGSGKDGYLSACHWRRVSRMKPYTPELKQILFSRHHNLGGMIIGYLEDLNSDRFTSGIGDFGSFSMASKSDNYSQGAAICVIDMKNYYSKSTDLIADTKGAMRDPCVSFDGKKVVFAWSKDNNGYHLFEIDIADPDPAKARQLTNDPDGLTVSDYEPCYLQNGDIVFNSSRCFGHVDCNFGVTSNLFMINKDGKYLRRIGFDQVQTFSPTMMSDGKVMYSRWEYNDRNIVNSCGLQTMNPDGCAQMEHFGNQTDWPSTIIQGRQIPGSSKCIAVFGAHEAPYSGELGIIDPTIARNGLKAIQLIAPIRDAPRNVNTQSFDGGVKYLFQNPYPLDEEWFMVSWRPSASKGYKEKFSIYLMNIKGERELLAWDTKSVSQPMSLAPRPVPSIPKYQADFTKTTAQVTCQDVYYGMGTGAKVTKGSVKKMRVIALEYRTDPAFGNTGSMGYTMTPVGRWTASWEAKRIIGETPVESDGSAAFFAPGREPLYFQLIDEKGRMVQTMRSWVTFQPGELSSCTGCHENKNEAPPAGGVPIAKPQALKPFFDIANDYLYYPTKIQPIFDKNCNGSGCHNESHKSLDLRGDKVSTASLGSADEQDANRTWCRSYYNLVKKQKTYVDWITIFSSGSGLPPYPPGSSTSPLIKRLLDGHKDLKLTEEEIGKLCAWIDLCIPHSGNYRDDMSPELQKKWDTRIARREKHAKLELENIAQFVADGGYDAYMGGSDVNPGRTTGKVLTGTAFKVRFRVADRHLSIDLPSEGSILIVDLHGRQVTRFIIGKDELRGGGEIHKPLAIPAGLYIVKFNGVAVSGERVISVL